MKNKTTKVSIQTDRNIFFDLLIIQVALW